MLKRALVALGVPLWLVLITALFITAPIIGLARWVVTGKFGDPVVFEILDWVADRVEDL